ncbi:MAG: S8 family peptidase [Bacteriovoracaceae bacterium]|nr:S8 family peptidase [Bacteriovoracaceae bacterium]
MAHLVDGGLPFKDEDMVRWLAPIGLFIGLLFLIPVSHARSKRFIVHYKTQKISTQGRVENLRQREILAANSAEEARRSFPLGAQNILEIEEDLILKPTLEPGDRGIEDSFYQSQWHYFNSDGGIELPLAWDKTVGSGDVVVAVVDTGILSHRDLQNKILPGADLISDSVMANDGGGRDTDATDTGDWVGPGDFCYSGRTSNSSWHGTHVAGTVGAETANGIGVAGVAWGVKILPVRVLGKCGGYLSDIADGIRWAAGGSVTGLPVNTNIADVINLSLGGAGACGSSIQSAIDFAVSRGSVVVVAAGNDQSNLNFSPYVPATCRNVITVGAGNRYAFRSFYSNYGDYVDVMAPGGDFDGQVFSTSNDGLKEAARDSYKNMMGTSMAAPHVAGVAALIKSLKRDLFPAQVEDILKRTTKYFNCTEQEGCGAGLINAFAALEVAESTLADGSFQGTEPISSFPDQPTGGRVIAYEDDSGGMCGSVAFVDGPKPPKGGLGAFLISLALGLFLSFARPRLKS